MLLSPEEEGWTGVGGMEEEEKQLAFQGEERLVGVDSEELVVDVDNVGVLGDCI